MPYTLRLGERTLTYTLERKRVKNINLRVRGGEVFVSAARWVPRAVIESFLLSRADRILSAVERSRAPELPPLSYLGCPLTLRAERGAKSAAVLDGGTLRLTLRDPDDPASVQRALDGWYRAESERLCRGAVARLLPCFTPRGVPGRIEIRMRRMRSCWGNCRPAQKRVTFNTQLAAVPERCLDYVVAHELTHFLHANHSSAFYAELARVMPDWKERRAALRPYGERL